MSFNIPFNPYKIYQTGHHRAENLSDLSKKISIACFLPKTQIVHNGFLIKVLEAAEISKDQVEIIPMEEDEKIPVAEIGWLGQLSHIFCIGLPLTDLYIQIKHQPYRLIRIRDTTILPIPGLPEIEKSREEKQKLWNLIKNVFIDE